MRRLGLGLLVLGLALALYFFVVFQTSVQLDDEIIRGEVVPGRWIENAGRLNTRQTGVVLGGSLAVIGAVLFVGSRRAP